MTLQASGAISLANVQTEFGGSNPIGINEYYGVAAGVPGSGTISLNNFFGKSASPVFGGWTYMMFGSQTTSSSSNGNSTFTGNTITPGIGNSPKEIYIYLYGGNISPYQTLTLQYYQGGSLNSTWTYTTSNFVATSYYQAVTALLEFGSSSMRFNSSISDPNAYDDIEGAVQVLTSGVFPYDYALYSHQHNLTGGGNYYSDVDYDD